MQEKFSLANDQVLIDELGRVVISDQILKEKLEAIVDSGDLVASNSCTNNGACGNDVNAGGCGNTVNGSCNSSLLNNDEILIQPDNVIIKNPDFNSQILNLKLEQVDTINIEFKALRNV
ncbi:hypothetical protein GCM10008090_30700 [Arenicella chitinivorans]|uniref:Uncharacterized protein n=1 Tax=Arenicella chitinivorans TaxID=1329800 RepID=A0A918S1K0_9GAMM|nr:hypothetical protein [Arenicella chitinivorans]GHA18904.1 hypothetical protein GCM10008090_30700 [Arenicella chitinivorans]